jgi:hypothetical protein
MRVNAPDSSRSEVATRLLEKVTALGNSLSASDLGWAIRMESAYTERGFLTDKQLIVLINIVAKYDGQD